MSECATVGDAIVNSILIICITLLILMLVALFQGRRR